jgi:hypothetical protein
MTSSITLGQVAARTEWLEVGCKRCGRSGRYSTKKLVEHLGAGFGVSELLTALASDCPHRVMENRWDRCGAEFPEIPELFRQGS